MKNEKFRIVWAVDPFAKPARFQRSAVRAIEQLTRNVEAEVIPIHVMAAGLQERLRKAPAESFLKIRHRAQANINGMVGPNLKFKPLYILAKKFASLKAGVSELIGFANKISADLIVLSTHAQKGPKRWLLGSFAETFSILSNVPIMITPTNWSPRVGKGSVLFATDFSRESRVAFDRLLKMAKTQKWGITIFHHVDYPNYPAYEYAFASWGSYEEDLREVTTLKEKQAKKFVMKAEKAGVPAELVIHNSQRLNVSDSIIQELRKGYLFGALGSQSGALKNALLGGTTRQLIRNSPVPVWVMHPTTAGKLRGTSTGRTIKKYTPSPDSARILF